MALLACRLHRPRLPSPDRRQVRHGGHARRQSVFAQGSVLQGLRRQRPVRQRRGWSDSSCDVDLKGHTLYGVGPRPRRHAFAYPGPAYLQVVNGRVENFEIGVGGDNDTRITNVKLVGNSTVSSATEAAGRQSYFKNNSVVGMGVGAEAMLRERQHLLGQQGGRVRPRHQQPRHPAQHFSTTRSAFTARRLGSQSRTARSGERHRSLGAPTKPGRVAPICTRTSSRERQDVVGPTC